MPPINPVPPKTKTKVTGKAGKPVKTVHVTVSVPDAHEETRSRQPVQPAQKVRMYAHPERPTAQNTFRTQRTEQVKQQHERQAVKKAVAKIHTTPVPSPDARDSQRSPAQQAHDKAVAAETVRTQRVKAVRAQNRGSGTRAVKQYIKTNVSDAIKAKTTTGGHGSGKFAVIEANLPVGAFSVKELKNAGKDAAELAVTTPSSVAHLVSEGYHANKALAGGHVKQAVQGNVKIAKELAQPYVQFAKSPVKAAEEKPVSTALMLQPVVRAPGAALGRVARIKGTQTLEREPATLPGTALKEARTRSRDYFVNKRQAAQDAKNPTPTMTQAQVERRVDEFHDFGQHHTTRAADSAAARAKQNAQANGLNKKDTADAVKQAIDGARGGAGKHVDELFGREFGAVHEISPQGHIVQPKGATEGALHDSRVDAERIAARLNSRPVVVARGRHTPLQAPRQGTPTDVEFVVRKAGSKYAVVPKAASERLNWHRRVGTSQAPGSKILRVAGRTFRTAVLPLSAKWLTGQVSEAGIRSVVAGAGPADLWRFRSVVQRMNRDNPGSGDALVSRITGGQFGLTGTAREFAEGRSLAEEFQGTAFEDIAHGLTKAGSTRPARAVRSGWGKYTNVVFNTVNGAIENTARKAMAGQAIRSGQFMENHIRGLSDRAIQDAADGLHGTHAQVQLGRAVDRMYGQYQKFSPAKRETLLHTTPFYPWYRNVATFITKTLPVDHPLKTALLTDIEAMDEDWRKSHGLSLKEGGGKPGFLLGGYPVGSGEQVVRYGRYTPFVPGDPLESVADLVTPQFGNVKEILHGHDYTGKEVKGNRILVALDSLAEAHIPGLAQVGRITGVPGHYIRKTGEPTIGNSKNIPQALRREVDPFMSTRPSSAPSGSSSPTGRVKLTGAGGGSGRVKLPGGATGRVKIP